MKRLCAAAIAVMMLAACTTGASDTSAVEATAREKMTEDGFDTAAITTIVEGDEATRGADELYCVATDATTQNGELPYLLLVWRDGDQWQASQLMEGYYDWELQGCPR